MKPSPQSRLILCTLLAALALAMGLLAGCGAQNPQTDGIASATRNTLTDVLAKKQIRAAILIYPPTVDMPNGTNKPSGFLIDIMDEIAKRAGLSVSYEPTSWDDLKAAINSPRYDVVVGAVFVSVPRAKDMAFTTPIIYWQGVGVVVPANKADSYKTLDDLDKPSLRITATSGTVEYDFAKAHVPQANIDPIPNDDMTLTMAEVAAGRADAAFANFDTIRKYVANKGDLAIAFGGKAFSANAAGFVVKQGDADWRHFLDNALLTLQVDGTIETINEKYQNEATWTLPRATWQ